MSTNSSTTFNTGNFLRDILYGIVAVFSGMALELGTRVLTKNAKTGIFANNSRPYLILFIQIILGILVLYFITWFLFPSSLSLTSTVIFTTLFFLVQTNIRNQADIIGTKFKSNLPSMDAGI